MKWLRELLSDNRSGLLSTKRVTVVVSACCLGAAVIILAVAAYVGRNADVAITGVAASLAGLAGGVYVGGKAQERKKDDA